MILIGRRNTNLTDKEKFYNRICERRDDQDSYFLGITEEADSYLEDADVPFLLTEYCLDTVGDFERLFDTFCDTSIKSEKKECAKVYMKEYMQLERMNKVQLKEDCKSGVIPTYIYNF